MGNSVLNSSHICPTSSVHSTPYFNYFSHGNNVTECLSVAREREHREEVDGELISGVAKGVQGATALGNKL